MLHLIRQKKSIRFVLISSMLTVAAIGAAMISAIAGHIGEYGLATLGSKAALGLAVIIVIYVVPRMARSVRLEYLHSDFSINLPNAGLIFCVLIFVITILALTSGNNLLYLVLAVLLATMFISWVASRVCLGGVSVVVRYPDHIFVDETVPYDVTLTNRQRLMPVFSITVAMSEQQRVTSPRELAEIAYFPLVQAKTQARMRIERNFRKRGIYPVYGFVISTKFPFGFIEQRRFIEAPGEVVVYPKSQPLDDFFDRIQIAQGRVESRLKGRGSDLYAIRQYHSSDHHHHIDWKATAKTTRLMVREFTRDDDWRVTIAFDPHVKKEIASSPEFIEKFERAVTFTASLIDYYNNEGAEVRLLTGIDDSGYGIGRMHCYAMLRLLAQLEPETNVDGMCGQVKKEFSSSPGGDDQLRILVTSAEAGLRNPHLSPSAYVVSIEEL